MANADETPAVPTSIATSSAMPSLAQLAAEAADRSQIVFQQLSEIVFASDSVALLATLGSLRLTRSEGEDVDVDAFTRWQVKLEFLTWLAATRPVGKTTSAPIDAGLVERVEELLEEYFNAESLAVAGSPTTGDPEIQSLHHGLLMEAMHVRGEGTPEMVWFLARGLYSSHDEWFEANLGFTCDDAIAIVDAISALHADRLRDAYQRGYDAAGSIEAQWQAALANPQEDRTMEEAQLVEAVETHGLDWMASYVGGNETFSRMREVRGFTPQELSDVTPDTARKKIPAFLKFFSQGFGTVAGTPSPTEFNPLVEKPLLVDGGRYFVFVPPLLLESILNAPHYALIRDPAYRVKYDDARAAWLEQQATNAFQRLWPTAQIGWSVKYGPKGQRSELDGLVLRGNKVILIECKWKSLTLVAKRGDSAALRQDIAESILKAFAQGRRARDYIRSTTHAEFTDANGTVFRLEPNSINEIVILSVLGRGALSVIAANPLEARAFGFFNDGELPWALSLFDLLAVCRTMEFGGQFFDYARRRASVIADGRFKLHDEWDLLEFYFAGALDTKDPEFADKHMVTFTGSGRELEQLVLDSSATVPETLRRRIHPKVRKLLRHLDALPDAQATDAVAFALGMSDRQLHQMGEYWVQAEEMARADGKYHSVSALSTPGGGGFTIICGRGTRDEFERLQFLCMLNKYKHRAPAWLGIGALPGREEDPFAVVLDSRPWKPEPNLDHLFPVWPLPGTVQRKKDE